LEEALPSCSDTAGKTTARQPCFLNLALRTPQALIYLFDNTPSRFHTFTQFIT
jgi:hypothetical protein